MAFVFLAALIGLVASLVLGGIFVVRRKPVPRWGRVVLVACVAGVVPFTTFGFLASFEGNDAEFLAFRLGYAGLVVGSLFAIVWLCLPGRGKA